MLQSTCPYPLADMALKRIIARRDRPQRTFSDNGTNFVGANNELQKCLKQLDEERIQNFCSH